MRHYVWWQFWVVESDLDMEVLTFPKSPEWFIIALSDTRLISSMLHVKANILIILEECFYSSFLHIRLTLLPTNGQGFKDGLCWDAPKTWPLQAATLVASALPPPSPWCPSEKMVWGIMIDMNQLNKRYHASCIFCGRTTRKSMWCKSHKPVPSFCVVKLVAFLSGLGN